MKLIFFVFLSLFSVSSFSAGYQPTEKEFKKMEKELEKGKTKIFDSWIAKGMQWDVRLYGDMYLGSFWENVPDYVNSYPKSDVGWYVFKKMLDITPDINWHEGFISIVIHAASTQNERVINELLKRGADFRITLVVEHNGQILKRNALTAISGGGITRGGYFSVERYIKSFDWFVQYGVKVCDDGGAWMDHGNDRIKDEAIDRQYYKYRSQMIREGCITE